jgi:hypothetical protein
VTASTSPAWARLLPRPHSDLLLQLEPDLPAELAARVTAVLQFGLLTEPASDPLFEALCELLPQLATNPHF